MRVLGFIFALLVSTSATADLVLVHTEMSSADLMDTAISMCVNPNVTTKSAFIAVAQENGYELGDWSRPPNHLVFKNEQRHWLRLSTTGLEDQSALFHCAVTASGEHGNSLRYSLAQMLETNYVDTQDYPYNDGWTFNVRGQNYIVSITENARARSTSIVTSFTGTNS